MNTDPQPAANASERESEPGPFETWYRDWRGVFANEAQARVAYEEASGISAWKIEAREWRKLYQEQRGGEAFDSVQKQLAEARERIASETTRCDFFMEAMQREEARNKAQAEEIERLRGALEQAGKFMANHAKGHFDHACRICTKDDSRDFVCAPHRINEALAAQNPAGDGK